MRVAFQRSGREGPVPQVIRQYLAGQRVDPSVLSTPATESGAPYAAIYRAVQSVPYGKTATYGEIAHRADTYPRVVGLAMARNPTPLVVPCHRIVASHGIGGFTPDIEIKKALLAMEKKGSGEPRR